MNEFGSLQTEGMNSTVPSSVRPLLPASCTASRHGLPAVIEMNTSAPEAAIVVISLVTVGAATSWRTGMNSPTTSGLASTYASMPCS